MICCSSCLLAWKQTFCQTGLIQSTIYGSILGRVLFLLKSQIKIKCLSNLMQIFHARDLPPVKLSNWPENSICRRYPAGKASKPTRQCTDQGKVGKNQTTSLPHYRRDPFSQKESGFGTSFGLASLASSLSPLTQIQTDRRRRFRIRFAPHKGSLTRPGPEPEPFFTPAWAARSENPPGLWEQIWTQGVAERHDFSIFFSPSEHLNKKSQRKLGRPVGSSPEIERRWRLGVLLNPSEYRVLPSIINHLIELWVHLLNRSESQSTSGAGKFWAKHMCSSSSKLIFFLNCFYFEITLLNKHKQICINLKHMLNENILNMAIIILIFPEIFRRGNKDPL